MNSAEFAYITGLIRTLETKLLNQNELERMVDAKSFQDAYRVLNELDYSKYLDDIKSPTEFQIILNKDLEATKKLLLKTTPYSWFLNIFWYYYDIHNIKTALKAKLTNKTFEDIKKLLLQLGNISHVDIEKYIYNGEKPPVEHELKAFALYIDQAKKLYQKNKEPQQVDAILDKAYAETALKLVKKAKSRFLTEYMKKYVDLANIKLALRLPSWNIADEEKINLFIQGGGIDPKKLIQNNNEDCIKIIEKTEYKYSLENALTELHENNSYVSLENAVQEYLTKFIRQHRFTSVGPEVVINYLLAKMNNAMIIRMVLVGKMNDLNPQEIHRSTQKLYNSLG